MLHALYGGHRIGRSCAGFFFGAAFLASVPAYSQISLDATSTPATQAAAGATSLTWSHSLGSGSNRMIVCAVTYGYNDTAQTTPLSPAPSMTFNGLAMTTS